MALRIALLAGLVVAAVFAWANWPSVPLSPDSQADRVVVDKGERTLQLLEGDDVLKTYRVSFGAAPDDGHKQREGDERTPEGTYALDWRNAESCCFRSLHVSYPDLEDVARAEAEGVSPGGMVMIHGLVNGFGWIGRLHRFANWTDGCIAVTNPEIAEIWRAVPDGTPIEIRP